LTKQLLRKIEKKFLTPVKNPRGRVAMRAHAFANWFANDEYLAQSANTAARRAIRYKRPGIALWCWVQWSPFQTRPRSIRITIQLHPRFPANVYKL